MVSLHCPSGDTVVDSKYRSLDKWGALCPLFILIILFLLQLVKYYFKNPYTSNRLYVSSLFGDNRKIFKQKLDIAFFSMLYLKRKINILEEIYV